MTEPQVNVAHEVLSWCEECRLYAAKVIIWNAPRKHVQTICDEAWGYLPGVLGDEECTDDCCK